MAKTSFCTSNWMSHINVDLSAYWRKDNQHRQKICYRNHSHIITCIVFCFSWSVFFPSSSCVWLLVFFPRVVVIPLITDTKWLIKISLRTRYILVCSPIRDTCEKTAAIFRRAWKIAFAVVFGAQPKDRRKEFLWLFILVLLLHCWCW